MDGESSLDEIEYMNVRKQYNNPHTIFWDYNTNVNKFEITNKLSLIKWDGSILRYEALFVSNNGQYLLPYCKLEGFGVCRVDDGSKKVESYKKIKDYGDVNCPSEIEGDLNFYVCLSNDNKIATLYKQYRSNSLYVKISEFYTVHKSNTMKQCMEHWLSKGKK
mmetsp:Transcript_48263/g.49102  ORF Transcript_48263/g.49102 Transcript_48263/m.49102 type:complete len:163 (+) Transcript_48263:54-542(+)